MDRGEEISPNSPKEHLFFNGEKADVCIRIVTYLKRSSEEERTANSVHCACWVAAYTPVDPYFMQMSYHVVKRGHCMY